MPRIELEDDVLHVQMSALGYIEYVNGAQVATRAGQTYAETERYRIPLHWIHRLLRRAR